MEGTVGRLVDAPVEVALAVLRRGDAILLQRRTAPPQAGAWELPGGKVHPGESPAEAAVREVREELGVEVHDPVPLGVHEHRYPGGPWVRLHAFSLTPAGPIVEGPDLRWVPLAALDRWDVLEGTRPLLAGLRAASP
jgi:8-oxo-dGTP diphosphatase